MSLTTYHEFDHEGKHYRLVYDEDHQTRGSYGYDTEEETKAAEDEEIANLESGKWVVLGVITTTKCAGIQGTLHCGGCSGIGTEDSVWGCVVENDKAKAEEYAKATA